MSKAIENTALVTVNLVNDSTGEDFVIGRGCDSDAAIDAAVAELGKIGGDQYTWEGEYAGYTKADGDWLLRAQIVTWDEDLGMVEEVLEELGLIIVQEVTSNEEEAA